MNAKLLTSFPGEMTKLSEALLAPVVFPLALALKLGFPAISEGLKAILDSIFLPPGCNEEDLVLIRAGGTDHAMQIRISGESALKFCGSPGKVCCFPAQERTGPSPSLSTDAEDDAERLAENLWNAFFGAHSRWHHDPTHLPE